MIVCTETVLIGRKCDPMEEKVKQQYDRWLSQPGMPADLAEELKSIAGNEDAITDRFYRELEFGTGGLRGVIGAGTNRMNVYNIRKATQGLANYLFNHWQPEQGGHRYFATRNARKPEEEKATEVHLKHSYSEHKPPRPPKGYRLVEAKGSGYGWTYFKYVLIDRTDEKEPVGGAL